MALSDFKLKQSDWKGNEYNIFWEYGSILILKAYWLLKVLKVFMSDSLIWINYLA